MPRARDNGQTCPQTTRRTALTGLLASAAAVVVAAPAVARPSGTDAELIRLCNTVVEAEQRMLALFAIRHTVEDEHRTEPELDELLKIEEVALEQIDKLPPPSTREGALAALRAAETQLEIARDGSRVHDTDAEWLAFLAARAVLTNGRAAA